MNDKIGHSRMDEVPRPEDLNDVNASVIQPVDLTKAQPINKVDLTKATISPLDLKGDEVGEMTSHDWSSETQELKALKKKPGLVEGIKSVVSSIRQKFSSLFEKKGE